MKDARHERRCYSRATMKKLHRSAGPRTVSALLFAFVAFLAAPPLEALTVTAVASGSWHTPATWGGTVPGDFNDVEIPAGITVSILKGTSVTRRGPGYADGQGPVGEQGQGNLTVSGALVVWGTLSTIKFTSSAGAPLTINTGGTLRAASDFRASGPIVNNGTFSCNASVACYLDGAVTNESGAVMTAAARVTRVMQLTNRGSFTSGGTETELVGTAVENWGTMANDGMVYVKANMRNHQGARIIVRSYLKAYVEHFVNEGTIENSKDVFSNYAIRNTCTGVMKGSGTYSGRQPVLDCVGSSPTPVPVP